MSKQHRLVSRRRTPVIAVLAAVALAGGTAATMHWRSDARAADERPHPASVRSLSLPGATDVRVAPTPATTVRLPAGADRTATAAVTTFLRARAGGDVATSYALLAPDSRRNYATPAVWLDAQPDLPAPSTFKVLRSAKASGGADVTVDVRRTAVLNTFVGFWPARAIEVYRAVPVGAAWRVHPTPVLVQPRLISDAGAPAAVAAWLARHQACDAPGASRLQVSTELLGDDLLPAQICAAPTGWRVGPVQPLSGGPETAAFVAAYGPDLGSYARLVPVTGPGQSLLVGVAPLGSAWRVFGIVPGGSG